MISGSSVLSALFLYSAVLLPVYLLRRCTAFLKMGGVPVLLLVSAVATARLLLPFEIPLTYAVRSWTILAAPQRFFRANPAITRLLLTVWGVGAALFTGIDVLILCLARKRCRGYTVVESESVRRTAERLRVDCPVLVSPDVPVPYVAGVLHPVIYIPTLELPEWEIELILAHEAQHIRSHDALIKLFFGILSAALWWDPVAFWFRREIDTLLEMRCDAKVTERMDENQKTEYLIMLKNMAKRIVAGRRAPALALDESSAAGKNTVIEQRFKVLNTRASRRPRRLYTVAQCVLLPLFLMSYLVVFQPASAPPTENFDKEPEVYYHENFDGLEIEETDIIINDYSTFIFKGSDGRYHLYINYEFSRYLTYDEVVSDQYRHIRVFEEGVQE